MTIESNNKMVYDHILVRYGELSTKGKNKKDFIRRLHQNMKNALRNYPALEFERTHDRMYILLNGVDPDEIAPIISRIFGISSFSYALKVNSEIEDIIALPDNGRYLSIDLGVHNLMTCYNSVSGKTFIIGRKYLSLCHYYNKEIARVQSQWSRIQSSKGVKHPKSSKHINKLYVKKNNAINDYLHKITRYIANYCRDNNINTIVIGDITNIRENKDYGHVTNQKFHSLPYKKIYIMLKYKLALYGINFIMQKEAYSSQTSPLMDTVCKQNANKNNRVERGLYTDDDYNWNADSVGAFNILRLYFQAQKIDTKLDPISISSPEVTKVAA